MSSEISIRMDKSDLQKIIKKNITSKDADKIATVLAEHISASSIAFEQCLKAFMGIFPTLKYKVGDVVYINFTYLPTWRIDKDKTLKLPNVKGELVPAIITSTNMYSGDQYTIEYSAIANNESGSKKQTWQIHDRYIEYKEEQIEDFLEEIEKSDAQADDTPF